MSKSLRVAAVDLNGQLRGKRVAAGMADKQMRMPLSVLNIDVFGADIEDSPLVFESGDQDGIMETTDRAPILQQEKFQFTGCNNLPTVNGKTL